MDGHFEESLNRSQVQSPASMKLYMAQIGFAITRKQRNSFVKTAEELAGDARLAPGNRLVVELAAERLKVVTAASP